MNPQPTSKVTQMPKPEGMHAFMFYIDDWRASWAVDAMDNDEKVAYLNLLMRQAADPSCSLPDNDSELAVISGMELRWWRPTRNRGKRITFTDESGNVRAKSSGEKIRECFVICPKTEHLSNQRLCNERMYSEFLRSQEIRLANRARAKAGARAKWGQNWDACSMSQASENDENSMLGDAQPPPSNSDVRERSTEKLGTSSTTDQRGADDADVPPPESNSPKTAAPPNTRTLELRLTDAEFQEFSVHCADPSTGPPIPTAGRSLAQRLKRKHPTLFPKLPKYPSQNSPGLWDHTPAEDLIVESKRQAIMTANPGLSRKPMSGREEANERLRSWAREQDQLRAEKAAGK